LKWNQQRETTKSRIEALERPGSKPLRSRFDNVLATLSNTEGRAISLWLEEACKT
jgi:hypothetical protein